MIPPNGGPIRVLHVDDDPAFARLVATFLEEEGDGREFTVETTTDAEEALDRVRDRPPDCIVSDYEMPGTNGIELLRAVRADVEELPFILYTGKGSEEVAGEAISAGVTDYLQKGGGPGQYELLANRIHNAVRARRDARRLARQEQLMRLTEVAGDTGGWELDLDAGRVTLTAGARQLVGHEKESLARGQWFDLFHPGEEDVRETFEAVVATGREAEGTWRVRRDGGWRQVRVTMTPVADDGEVVAVRGALVDVTEYERREQRLARQQSLLKAQQESIPEGVLVVDENRRIVSYNDRFLDLWGLPEDLMDAGDDGRALEHATARLDDPETYREQVEYFYDNPQESARDEVRFEDGTVVDRYTTPLVGEDGTHLGRLWTFRDVTERRRRERQLERTRERMERALEATGSEAFEIDVGDELDGGAGSFGHLDGTDLERLRGTDGYLADGVHPEDRERVASALASALEEAPATVDCEYRTDPAEGDVRWRRWEASTRTDEDGRSTTVVGLSTDVTDRKRRERELERYEQVFESAVDGVFVVDRDRTVVDANRISISRAGLSPEEVFGAPLMPLVERYAVDGADVERFEEALAAVLDDPGDDPPEPVEVTLEVDGRRSVFEYQFSPVTDGDGTTDAVVVARDTTERHERLRELKRTRELLAEMERIADAGGWEYDPDADAVTITDGTHRIYGIEPGSDPGLEETFEFFDSPGRERLEARFAECIETGDPYEMDLPITTADGDHRWVGVRGERVSAGTDGTVVRGYVQDITARKRRETRLEKVETLFRNARDMLFVIDCSGDEFVVERVNEAFETATGLSNDYLQGKTPREVFGERRGRQIEDNYRKCIESGEALTYEETVSDDKLPGKESPVGGTQTYWETRVVPVESDGETTWIVGVTRDMNERKRREQRLERQNERLEKFVDMVSHDLRNPLEMLRGYLEVAAESGDPEHFAECRRAADRMEQLIEDLLALSRAGDAIGETEPVSLSTVAEQCWATVPTEAATLAVETDRTVRADRSRLRQLLENLFDNAVEHGGSAVTVTVGAVDDGFYVADTGAGVPEDRREDLFEPGYSTAEDGTGFGLQIVEEIADAHGWTVRVTDADGGGARFEVTGVTAPRS